MEQYSQLKDHIAERRAQPEFRVNRASPRFQLVRELNLAARAVHLPGMHLGFGKDLVSPPGAGAEPLDTNWAGESSLRTLKKATHLGLLEGRHWSDILLDGKGEASTRNLVRALLTGFLLHRLGGDGRYAAAFDGPIKGTEVRSS